MRHSLQATDLKAGRLYQLKPAGKSVYGAIVGNLRIIHITSDRNIVTYLNTAFPQSPPISIGSHRFLMKVEHEVFEPKSEPGSHNE